MLETEFRTISHIQRDSSLKDSINKITTKIRERGDLSYVTVARQLELVELLSQFDFGRFLLQYRGLNGYWTHYIVTHPSIQKVLLLNNQSKQWNELEAFILNEAPWTLATQQRFEIFKIEIQKRLFNGINLASIPCGLMADLLDLDFSQIDNFSLTGVDLDAEAITQARLLAAKRGLVKYCQFYQKDAWNLQCFESFDLVVSNGLSIYEPDNEKVIVLYNQIFRNLKSGGSLITSFLTPPPALGSKTEWNLAAINQKNILLQRILFLDILESSWQVFRSEDDVKNQLYKAGFSQIEVIYDIAHIFPTIIAQV